MRIAFAVALAPFVALACSSSEAPPPLEAPSSDGGVAEAASERDGGDDDAGVSPSGPVTVVLETDKGDIELELDPARAPVTVANFLSYVDEKHYDGTIFHRVIPDFMIQGGGYDVDSKERKTREPIVNEADNGLKNVRGAIAMARTTVPDSATAQFFIDVVDNPNLDFTAKTKEGWGYAVFGKVTSGIEVADAIVAVPTGARGPFSQDAPLTPVLIKSAHRR